MLPHAQLSLMPIRRPCPSKFMLGLDVGSRGVRRAKRKAGTTAVARAPTKAKFDVRQCVSIVVRGDPGHSTQLSHLVRVSVVWQSSKLLPCNSGTIRRSEREKSSRTITQTSASRSRARLKLPTLGSPVAEASLKQTKTDPRQRRQRRHEGLFGHQWMQASKQFLQKSPSITRRTNRACKVLQEGPDTDPQGR